MRGILTQGGRLGMGHAAIDPAIHSGVVAAAHTVSAIGGEKPNAIDAAAAVEAIAERVRAGDTSDLETILIGQAVALNVMSMDMLARARKVGTPDALNTLGAAGLRAVAQSRAAIDSLVNLRNPRQVSFVKQANINNGGQQQVNNTDGVQPSRARTRETIPHSELLTNEVPNVLDAGTPRAAGLRNTPLEAVAFRDRATKPRRTRSVGA